MENKELLPLYGNLDKRICDVEEGATNTDTYRDFIIVGWESINCPLSQEEIARLDLMSNLELNKLLEELDYLLDK